MKLNWAERWVVNNPLRVLEQQFQMGLFKKMKPLAPGAAILEVGCGRGAGAKLIWKTHRPSLLCALDLDEEMIVQAKRYLSGVHDRQVFLQVGDVLHIPFRDRSLDAVFGFGVLHHVPDWRSALAEIARVLKAGGLYFIEELYPALYQNLITKRILLHPRENRFLSDDLREALHKIGLPIQDAVEVKKLGILGVARKKPYSSSKGKVKDAPNQPMMDTSINKETTRRK
jgi:ubiquinone/menaquinone biosynthesis C-methylase UbiE